MNKITSLFLNLILFGVLFFSNVADAATLSLVPQSKVLGVGQEFYIDIIVDTKEVFINAVQSKLTFSNDVLELVGFEKNDSIFNFWIEEPDVSNNEGIASFIGGTDKGASGKLLKVLRLKFKTVGSGNAVVSLSESVVTANDGKGTNVLDSIENISLAVGTNIIESKFVSEVQEEVPQKIDRPAIVATKKPEAPVIKIPLYPDSNKWYNHQGEMTVLWEVLDDTTKVAVAVDNSPRTVPPVAEKELFTGKKIGVLDEGEHYIHVQFRNNQGWGEVTHYKISIDTTPPPSFKAQISALVSDNPIPKIGYKDEDGLSGYSHALLFVDGGDSIYSTSTPFYLPPQKPGKHNLIVRVFDKAGNSSEDTLDFEVLPLSTPVVEFITSKISEGDVFFFSGRSIPKTLIDYRVFKGKNEVFMGTTDVGIGGKWKVSIEEVLLKGDYYVTLNARDSRGATSYDTEKENVKIKEKAIISFGFVELGWFEIALIIILLVISGGSLGSWYYISEREKKNAYGVIASRDVAKMGKLLSDNLTEIESLVKQQKRFDKGLRPQLQTVFNKMRTNINNMKKYLGNVIKKSK